METYRLGAPWALLALALIPALLLWRYRRGGAPVWLVPYAAAWMQRSRGPNIRWRMFGVYAAIVLLIVAAARPQRVETRQEVAARGSDIVLAVDLSTSMLAEDYEGPEGPINRLEAIKPVVQAFIEARPNDRIAIVVFANRAYTLAPLTTDHHWLQRQVDALHIGFLEDGTALGDSLGIALTHLETDRRAAEQSVEVSDPDTDGSGFIVLLTDGANTSGTLTPPQATVIARHRGIPVYTIAAGRNGLVPFPIFDDEGERIGTRQMPSSIDLEALQIMSAQTGGRHFAADDGNALAAAFADIDAAQKVAVQFRTEIIIHELFAWLIVAALVLLLWALPILRLGRAAVDVLPNIRRGRTAGGDVHFGDSAGKTPLPWRLGVALLFALIALARPQWGSVGQVAYEPNAEVVIALDLSHSMLAADLTPSRLEHARAVATALLDQLPDRRIGLVGFAGTAFLLAPPSRDRALAQEFLSTLAPRHFVEQGTDLLAVLQVALDAFSEAATNRTLVLLTDGEAESTGWHESLAELRRRSIRIVAVGFGTPGGAPIPTEAPGNWLRDASGTPVQSHLDIKTLSELTDATDGTWFEAAHAGLLTTLQATIENAEDQHEAPFVTGTRPQDRFVWFIAGALLMLAWSVACEWPARPRLQQGVAARSGETPAVPLLLMLVACVFSGAALHSRSSVAAGASPPASAEEKESLTEITLIVARLVEKRSLTSTDYLELARASVQYGEVHRGHAHPISEGILFDGLAAVMQGRSLDPSISDWDRIEARLQRLLEPPPPVPEDDSDADPANEPLDARRDVPVPQDTASEEESDDSENETLEQEPLRNVGGSRWDVYDPEEWQQPSLIIPLQLLQQIRGTDSPAELLRFMQASSTEASDERGQAW